MTFILTGIELWKVCFHLSLFLNTRLDPGKTITKNLSGRILFQGCINESEMKVIYT